MNKKSIYGLLLIAVAAIIAMIAVTLYGRTIRLNYIEQIHLQDGYLYYVDRGETESLKIIRSDTEGKNGDVIICKKHDREQYRIIRQIFFDDENHAYVLMEEMNVESWNGVRCMVYQCDFEKGALTQTGFDLTDDNNGYSQLLIQHIKDGCLYYIGIPDSEKEPEPARLFALEESGDRTVLEEVPLEYPYLNSQFFLSQDHVLLWMDYAGQIRVREIGAGHNTKMKGITGKTGVFKSLSDDGTRAYVLDYRKKCIRSVDLSERSSEIAFSEKEIQKKYPEFTFQNLQSIDCTRDGFCAGVADETGLVSVCSYQNGKHQDIHEITLTPRAIWHCRAWAYIGILLAAVLLCVYWIVRVKYHFQSILVRLCLVFLFGLLVMDGFLEHWIGQSVRRQLEGNQTISLSALGKVLKEDLLEHMEKDAQVPPSGEQSLALSHRSLNEEQGVREQCMYAYSILQADENGQLYVSESMSEYCGVPVEWVYTGETLEEIYQAYDSGRIVNKMDEDRNGRRNNRFIPLVLEDGTKCGVLVVSVNGNILDYQVWYFQWSLKNVSSMLLLALTVILLVILLFFLRPLKSLKECAGKLAAGNFGITVPVHGQDEVAGISLAFNQMSLELEKYVQDIRGISDGYYKFVPSKILDLLDRESIQEVKLGDQVTGDYTILSLHAIDYPKQSVSFSAEQVYRDINKVLSILVEPVNRHSGMVEHFEDTGLSALFIAGSRAALDAAVDMQKLLRERMPGKGRTIAISYGQVVIGVIGHKNRMEVATISAHSDLAKALRLKGDKYGAHILITHLVYKQIPEFEEHYHARYLGNIYLTANNTYERVYDVYDGDSEEEFYNKEQTKPLFEKGVGLFVAKKFYEARLVFVEVLKQHRKDQAAKEYLYRCDKYYKLASVEEIETVIEKF